MPIQLHIVIEESGSTQRDFTLTFDKPSILLGRDKSCDVVLPLSTISRRHAAITYQNQTYYVEDLNSTHGTYLNNSRLSPHQPIVLHENDTIRIVHAHLQFTTQGAHADSKEDSTSVVARQILKSGVTPMPKHIQEALQSEHQNELLIAPIPHRTFAPPTQPLNLKPPMPPPSHALDLVILALGLLLLAVTSYALWWLWIA